MPQKTLIVALAALILVTVGSIGQRLYGLWRGNELDRAVAVVAGGLEPRQQRSFDPPLAREPSPIVDSGPRMSREDAVRYGWVFEYEQGIELTAETGKPLMVVIRCLP